MAKSEARDEALAALYATEQRGAATALTEGLTSRPRRLVAGVWEHRESLDVAIDATSEGWRVERMPVVDRNILRIALFELRTTDTPVGVIVSEAVRMAKEYSTEKSGPFINGVLANLARQERSATEA